MIKRVLLTLVALVNEMSPYVLIGFLFAGLLHVLVHKRFYQKYLSQDNAKSVTLAALFGVPLPLCSCGVIPTAMSLRREGVSKSATISFLIATPQTGIDSILATYSVFGLAFAVTRPIAALCTAFLAGLFAAFYFRKHTGKEDENKSEACSASCRVETNKPKRSKFLEIFKYGFVDMFQDIGGHLLVGLLLAGLITILVPDAWLLQFAEHPLLEILIVLLISIPTYVCATGSIPIAAALMLKGLSPGAALVFLMAGPASNMASIMVIRKVMGKKSLCLYLCGIVVGAICFGMVINALPATYFNPVTRGNLCFDAGTPWWKWTATFIFTILLLNALVGKYIQNHKNEAKIKGAVVYKVSGMSCNHCKNSVETNVANIAGVTSTVVNLDKGELCVTGTASEAEIRKVVDELGFKFEGR